MACDEFASQFENEFLPSVQLHLRWDTC